MTYNVFSGTLNPTQSMNQSSLFPYLSFPLRVDPLRFQATGRKRPPNLGFFSCFLKSYYLCYTIFVFLMHDYLCCVSLDLLYIFVVISSGF